MWITPLPPSLAHGERFTWLNSQWKLSSQPAQFWVEINSVVVPSPIVSQSRERAIAWTREVIAILKLNGIDAEIETFYT
jgi:hypothetical protein